jgi:uncharacterized protein (DUF2342 family)
MEAAAIDWSMGSRAAVLVDWGTAAEAGRRVGGSGPPTPAIERARMREDLAEVVPTAESLIADFTGLSAEGGFRSRPWVMSRGEWVGANLRGLQRLLEPLAQRLVPEGASRSDLRRKALGAQVGGLLGYASRKVLGQYDAFLPPDDDGLLYFVGPNLVEVEHSFRDFRMWSRSTGHAHVQFRSPWLRGYLQRLIDGLETVQGEGDARADPARGRGGPLGRGLARCERDPAPDDGRAEGYLRPDAVADDPARGPRLLRDERGRPRLCAGPRPDAQRAEAASRSRGSVEKAFQQAIGFEAKMQQYAAGERFVRKTVELAGMDGLNRIWQEEANLPTREEITEPVRWVSRVAGA